MNGKGRGVSNVRGYFRDVLWDGAAHVIWDTGWRANVIVDDCRRLLAAFMRGAPTASTGINGIKVGAGVASWDQTGTPPATAGVSALVDPHPFVVPRGNLQMNFLAGANVSPTPTNRVQIVATLGPGVPTWPDANHMDATLREFGLFGDLDGQDVLIDYVTHPAIVKDPASTLDRTIWLVF